jgi:predicted RNase H-like nuclease (RuvC/YqgF family)
MKKNAIIEALNYENFVLKTRYNEIVEYVTKLQNELKTIKEKYSKETPEPQIRIISFLQEKNAKLNKELNEKNKELTKLINEPFVLLESQPSKTTQPLFHISKYKAAPLLEQMDNDSVSEITQD